MGAGTGAVSWLCFTLMVQQEQETRRHFCPKDLLQKYSGYSNIFSRSRESDLIQEIALNVEVKL
jgi:hypothetical protein